MKNCPNNDSCNNNSKRRNNKSNKRSNKEDINTVRSHQQCGRKKWIQSSANTKHLQYKDSCKISKQKYTKHKSNRELTSSEYEFE